MDVADTAASTGARKPAPGPVRDVQLFLNTRDTESQTDELADRDGAAAWLRLHGLLDDGGEVDDDGRRRLVELRESLRALAMANHGDPLDGAAVAAISSAGEWAPLRVAGDDGGRVRLVPAAAGTAAAAARILAIVHDAMVDGTWSRLKVCRDDGCQWAFYDHSRNRSSNWCAMAVCGNRAKARAYRRRRAGEAAPPAPRGR